MARDPNQRPHLWTQRTVPLSWSSDIGVPFAVLVACVAGAVLLFGPIGLLIGAVVGIIAGPTAERVMRGDRLGPAPELRPCAVCGSDTISSSGRCTDHAELS